jgi:hypothetical protein
VRPLLVVLACLLLPAAAAQAQSTPVVGKNAELVNQLPEAAGAVALEWHSKKPLMVLTSDKGLITYDVTDPLSPKRLGVLPLAGDGNEGMDLVERGEKTYALIGANLAMAAIRGTTPKVITSNRHLLVADVSNPAMPVLVADLELPTRTHTVSCATPECPYAYSDGRAQGRITIVDLADPTNPKVADQFKSVVPSGHDQDVDEAGILWHVGGQGSVALDVTNPTKPVQLNSTTPAGNASTDYSGKPYNNFIHHNSYRPNGDAFDTRAKDSGAADLDKGNVLLVTEEDYLSTAAAGRCGDYEGSFQTWRIPFLDAERYAALNPDGKAGGGTIEPLDRWNTEVLDSGQPTPAGAFCSAHYFDYLPGGFVAQGWYQQGTRILDVRDPADIKQVGYFFTGAMETWASYWVPKRFAKGQTIVYTADHVRGIDILKVTLPKAAPAKTKAVRAPILPEWIAPKAGLEARASEDWGFVCPLPLG